MAWLAFKYAVTAALVVAISELAKRSGKAGAFVAALPLVTLMALVWMHIEQQPSQKIADQARYTFWYVLPTLPMFLLFPVLLPRIGFWQSLSASAVMTVMCFGIFAMVLRRFGINLL